VRSAEPDADSMWSLISWQQQLVITGERSIKHALDILSLWRSCGRGRHRESCSLEQKPKTAKSAAREGGGTE
jgi:hypothetical protein